MPKSINETFVYKHLNGNGAITNTVASVLKDGEQVSPEMLAEPLLTINKNYKFPLKSDILNAYNKGEIMVIYSNGKSLPIAMPFFLTNVNGKVVAIICINVYGVKKDKYIDIDAKKLYCLMESAYLTREMYLKPSSFTNVTLITEGSQIYSNMFLRILNKKYYLNLDKSKMNKVIFLTSKFFAINHLGIKDSEGLTQYAFKNCVQGNPVIIKQFDDSIPPETYNDLSTLIEFMKDEFFPDITVRGFLEQYIMMYGASATFALESFPQFIYNIFSVSEGARINNQYALEELVGSSGDKLYMGICRTIK